VTCTPSGSPPSSCSAAWGPADDVALVMIRLLPAPLGNRRAAVPTELALLRREVRESDDGRWRPPAADPGHRGRGLLIVDRLTGLSSVEGSAAGTVVRFVVAPPADPFRRS